VQCSAYNIRTTYIHMNESKQRQGTGPTSIIASGLARRLGLDCRQDVVRCAKMAEIVACLWPSRKGFGEMMNVVRWFR
jgi:hypothetical protein